MGGAESKTENKDGGSQTVPNIPTPIPELPTVTVFHPVSVESRHSRENMGIAMAATSGQSSRENFPQMSSTSHTSNTSNQTSHQQAEKWNDDSKFYRDLNEAIRQSILDSINKNQLTTRAESRNDFAMAGPSQTQESNANHKASHHLHRESETPQNVNTNTNVGATAMPKGKKLAQRESIKIPPHSTQSFTSHPIEPNGNVAVVEMLPRAINEQSEQMSKQPSTPTPSSSKPTSEKFELSAAQNLSADHILSLVQCMNCLKPSRPPILTCLTGHIICNKCRSDVSNCPSCHQSFSRTRNFLAEQLTQNLTFECKFHDQGCKVKLNGDMVEGHEEGCDFKPIRCQIFPCRNHALSILSKDVDYKEFIRHLETQHTAGGAPFNRSMWRRELTVRKPERLMRSGRRVPFLLECFGGKTFLQCGDSDGQILWMWVAILGNSKEASKYHATLTLLPGDLEDKTLKSEWTGPVHSIRDDSIDILRSGYCMVTSEPCLKSFFCDVPTSSGNYPNYKLKISIKKIPKTQDPQPSTCT